MIEYRVPLTPLSPPSQSLTLKVSITPPTLASSENEMEAGGSMNSGGQSLKSNTSILTSTSPDEQRRHSVKLNDETLNRPMNKLQGL